MDFSYSVPFLQSNNSRKKTLKEKRELIKEAPSFHCSYLLVLLLISLSKLFVKLYKVPRLQQLL